MGITQIIDPFYQRLNLRDLKNRPVVGQFCWIAAHHVDKIPRILEVERNKPTDHFGTDFVIRTMTDQDFKKKTKLPIKYLSLRETEELVIHRAKRRLAITVTAENTIFEDIKEAVGGREHLQEENILVLPLYGIESASHEGGFPSAMVARIRALMYRQFFFCPNFSEVYEGIVRLDRVQPLIPQYPGWQPVGVSLSGEALGVLMSMLREYFGAPQDENMKVLRELVQDALPKDAKIPQT